MTKIRLDQASVAFALYDGDGCGNGDGRGGYSVGDCDGSDVGHNKDKNI